MSQMLTWILLLQVIKSYLFISANSLRITVDPVNGNNSGCEDGSHPCQNITTAFNVRQNDVQYILYQGYHYLHQSVSAFGDVKNLYIGSVDTSVTPNIVCANNYGLTFINAFNVTIQGAVFIGCGVAHNSTTCDPRLFKHSAFSCSLAEIRAALYFYLSESVALYNVTVQDSIDAAGLVLYDTVGTNIIANCFFVRNGVRHTTFNSSNTLGGGGVHIEFSYCAPSKMCNTSAPFNVTAVSNSHYFIYRNYFGGNSAQTVVAISTFVRPTNGYQSGLGSGGGLSILFYGFASNNNMSISDCVFQSNTGVMGGGLALESRDYAKGNSVYMLNSVFVSNEGSSNGGGLSIVDIASAGSITVYISNCIYGNNSALIGGAVSILAMSNLFQRPNYLFSHCSFQNNTAVKVGTVIAAFLQFYIGNGVVPFMKIAGNSVVTNNILSYSKGTYDMGIGAIYTSGIPVVFDGQILFQGNSGTALVSDGAHIDFCTCNASFVSNQGVRGGAIALLSNSYINLCNNSILRFIKNNAFINGGAIYNSYIQQANAECFMRYSDPHLLPSEWKAMFLFSGNMATFSGNAIYSSSVLPCSISLSVPHSTFCWNQQYWNYSGDACTKQIASDPGSITVNSSVKVFPGQIFSLPLVVRDDLKHNVLNETIFAAAIAESNRSVAGVSEGFAYVSNGFVQLYGISHGNVTLELNEVGLLGWHIDVNVELLDCPPGLISAPATSSKFDLYTCMCSQQIDKIYGSTLLCSSDSLGNAAAMLKQNHWMGYYPGTNTLVVGTCSPRYCLGSTSSTIQEQYTLLPMTVDELNGILCTKGRTGVLCGDCVPGYAVAVNSLTFACVECRSSEIAGNATWFAFLTLLSLLAVPIFIIVAGNYVTNGYANGLILFCQLISSTFDLTANGEIDMNYIFPNHGLNMYRAYRVVYGLFNLDGLIYVVDPFCLGNSIGVLGVIALKYIAAIGPLAILFLSTLVCCKKSILKCCVEKCFKKNRHPIHIAVAFILLSFNNICITTTQLLNSQSLRDSSGTTISEFRSFYDGGHKWMWYLLPLFLIPIVLPISLLLCGCKHTGICRGRAWNSWENWGRGLWEMCSDAFYACYKPEMQWFAAAYFIVRIVVASAFILAEPAAFIFMIQQITCIITILVILIAQPYKEKILNIWDAFILTYLIILSTLSQFNLAVYGFSYQRIWIQIFWCVQFILLILPFFLWSVMIYCMRKKFIRLLYLTLPFKRCHFNEKKNSTTRRQAIEKPTYTALLREVIDEPTYGALRETV